MEIVNIKCGEIFFTKDSLYNFYCIHCEDTFHCIEEFKKHNLNHFLVDTNNASVIQDSVESSSHHSTLQTLKIEKYQNLEILDTEVVQEVCNSNIAEFTNERLQYDINDTTKSDKNIDSEEKIINNDSENVGTLEIESDDYANNNYENTNEDGFQCFYIDNNDSDDDNEEFNSSQSMKFEIENEDEDKELKTQNFIDVNQADNLLTYCSHCELSFPNLQHDLEQCEMVQKKVLKYNRNLKFLRAEGIYLCEYCPRYFETNKNLKSHQKKYCEEKSNFHKITNSDEKTKNYNTLKKHNSSNLDCANKRKNEIQRKEYIASDTELNTKNEYSQKCPHCKLNFRIFQNHNYNKCLQIKKIKLLFNNYVEILNEKGIYVCKECPRYFDDEVELIFHRRKHYNIGYCPICFNTFAKLDIIEHFQTVHSDLKCTLKEYLIKPNSNSLNKQYECKYCKKKFVSNKYWKRHLLIHENKELQCNYCNKVCQSSIILRNHERTHTGERPFICQLCPAAFSLKHNLDSHVIYKHTVERPFECRYEGGCGKNFKTDQLRNYHERRHTGEILGKCDICKKEYRNKSAYRKHMKIRHMNYNERPYQCEYCDKKFVQMGQLTEHIRGHTGEKPLQCNICLKNFSRLTALREHQKLHTGEKNHVCSICGKAFAQKAGYFNHLKYHT